VPTTPVAEPVIASEPTPATAPKPRQTPEQYAAEREPHIVRNRAEKVRRVVLALGDMDLKEFGKLSPKEAADLAKKAGVHTLSPTSWEAVRAALPVRTVKRKKTPTPGP